MPEETDGPYVQPAALCEKVLQEKDGVLSLIRLIDRVTFTIVGTGDAGEDAGKSCEFYGGHLSESGLIARKLQPQAFA